MPILEVTALPQARDVDVEAVASALSRAVSTELGTEARGTWAVWRTVEPGHYLEGADPALVQPADSHPPIVRVVAYRGRPSDVISRVLTVVAETLVAELGLAAGNAFVIWDESPAGRVYSGGSVQGA